MQKDYNVLIKELLISVRKNLSQEQLNRRMRFNTNQIARWESGHTKIDWQSFCSLTKATKSPLEKAFKKHLFYEDAPDDSKTLVRALTHFHSQKSLATNLSVSKSFVSRLIAGRSEPSLEIILRLIDLSPCSLVDFIGALTEPLVPASIRTEQERIAREKQFHFEHPWGAALLLFMRTLEYQSLPKHSDKLLAERMKLPITKIKEGISTFLELGIIEKRGELYSPLNQHLSTGGSFEGAKNIRRYWLNHCLQELEVAKPGGNMFMGYKVFNVTQSAKKQFEEFYFRMNAELDQIIKNSQGPSEKVYLFSCQLVDLGKKTESDAEE